METKFQINSMRNKKAKKEPIKGVDEIMKIKDSKIIKSGEIKKDIDEIKDIKDNKKDNIILKMNNNRYGTEIKNESNNNEYIINKENINDNINGYENPINDFNKNKIEEKNKENTENKENAENKENVENKEIIEKKEITEKKKIKKMVRIR